MQETTNSKEEDVGNSSSTKKVGWPKSFEPLFHPHSQLTTAAVFVYRIFLAKDLLASTKLLIFLRFPIVGQEQQPIT